MKLKRSRAAAAVIGLVLALGLPPIVATSANAAVCNYKAGASHKVIGSAGHKKAQAFLETSCTYGKTRAFYTLNGGPAVTSYSAWTSHVTSGAIVAESPETVGGNVPTAFQSRGYPGGTIEVEFAKRYF